VQSGLLDALQAANVLKDNAVHWLLSDL
jgi:hypothetical protein